MTLSEARFSESESPGLALWKASMAWQARQRVALKQHDLTHVQFVLLAAVVHGGKPITQAELARTLELNTMMTSQVLRALEAADLIQRQRSELDARAILVTATAAGVERANAAVHDVEAVDRDFFAPAEDQIPELTRMLRSLAPGRHSTPRGAV